jgi:hypothetical protein
MSGRKDGLFFIDLAASHCLLILWLSPALSASYTNIGSCAIQNGNESSNHTSSATQSRLQRIPAGISRQIRETCPYFAILPRQTGLERTNYSAVKSVTVPAFLWMAQTQSGFEESMRRMQCDHKQRIWAWRVDFCRHLGADSGASHMPVVGYLPVCRQPPRIVASARTVLRGL